MHIPCSWVKYLWLVSLLLLITHAHPLFVGKIFVVSESIIVNHTHKLLNSLRFKKKKINNLLVLKHRQTQTAMQAMS